VALSHELQEFKLLLRHRGACHFFFVFLLVCLLVFIFLDAATHITGALAIFLSFFCFVDF
jgi:membrane-bound metal-dependent hydrolase YbcI (DUF457 family)